MQKNKHDHKATNIIKTLIFGAFMLMPFAAILSTTAYATFNDNAKDSMQLGSVQSITEITNPNDMIENVDYQFIYKTYETTEYNYIPYIEYNSISINWTDYGANNKNYIKFRIRTSDNLIQIIADDNTVSNLTNVWGNTLKSFFFNYKSKEYNISTFPQNIKATTYTYRQETLINTFYYAAKQVEEQPLFAWTKETGTYQTFKLLTNGFENNDNFIPVVLTYMFMTTCIYLIIDIVIESAIWLTHMIAGNKE